MLSPWLHIPSGNEHLPSKATSRDKSQRLLFLPGTQQKDELNERASGRTSIQPLSGWLLLCKVVASSLWMLFTRSCDSHI